MRRILTKRVVILGSVLTVIHFVATWASAVIIMCTDQYPAAGTIFFIMLFPEQLLWKWMPFPRPIWVGWLLMLLNSALWGWGIAFVIGCLGIWRAKRAGDHTAASDGDAQA